ncbi:MAG: hypothetical protein HGA25_00175 [Clostridiales bacterium]|nr:hypothetical protein [Clostridiales bacterium]
MKKKILETLFFLIIVPIAGYALLHMTFLLDSLYQGLFVNQLFENPTGKYRWFAYFSQGSFALVMLLVSFVFMQSKLPDSIKAIFAPVPAGVIFITISIYFYKFPLVTYTLCVMFYCGSLFHLRKNKKSWIYYYSITLTGLIMLVLGLMGMNL